MAEGHVAPPGAEMEQFIETDLEAGEGRGSFALRQTESAFEAAAREGGSKFVPLNLAFTNINYVVTTGMGRKKKDKIIIDNASGYVKEGTFVAIMGPSGSGKTSLLNVLAGRVAESSNTRLTGEVLVNGQERGNTFRRISAYVMQDDVMFSTLTLWETLVISAQLRLPSAIPAARKLELVDSIINELGLSKARNTVIGSSLIRGISGGERKRANIAVEMLSNPALLFLDEPTSGLDSFQALNVMTTMSDLAKSGRTVVSTIHQPRSSIFALFETLILLSEGRVLYFGKASDAVPYFTRLNYRCPEHYNPADYYMDIIAIDRRDENKEAGSTKRIEFLAANYTPADYVKPDLHIKSILAQSNDDLASQYTRYASSLSTQFSVLLKRAIWQVTRDRLPLIITMAQAIVIFAVLSILYSDINNTQKGVQNRQGVVFFAVIFFAFNGVFAMTTTFPLERPIVSRERASNSYRVLPYYVAKFIAEWPFRVAPVVVFIVVAYWPLNFQRTAGKFFIMMLIAVLEATAMNTVGLAVSAVAPTPEAAVALGPLVTVIFMLFGGFFINLNSIPVWIRWFARCSPIQWGFIGVAVDQFRGLTFTCDDLTSGQCIKTGEQVLVNLSISQFSVWGAIGYQCLVIGVLNVVAYLLLEWNGPRLQPISRLKKEDKPSIRDGPQIGGGAEAV